MKKALAALLVALLIPVTNIQSVAATTVKPKDKNAATNWSQLTGNSQVWILGNKVHVYECLGTSARGVMALKKSDGWVKVASSVTTLDSKLCGKSTIPFAAKYEFVLNLTGDQDFPGTHAKLLVYRIVYPQGSKQGLSAVYDDATEFSEDHNDGKLPGVASEDETEAIAPTPTPIKTKESAPPTLAGDLGWQGCTFNGVPMYGRVKVVSVGGQFKIRIVNSKPKLQVKGVKRAAKACGEWQFVSSAPAFTVEIVRAGEDFSIALGTKRSGLSR